MLLVIGVADRLAVALDVLLRLEYLDVPGARRRDGQNTGAEEGGNVLGLAGADVEGALDLGLVHAHDGDIVAGRQVEPAVGAVAIGNLVARAVDLGARLEDADRQAGGVDAVAALDIEGVEDDAADADDDVLLDGLAGGELQRLADLALADLDGQLLLAGRQNDFRLAVIGRRAGAAGIVDDDGGRIADVAALVRARPDDERAGIEHEDRRCGCCSLDLNRQFDGGFAEAGADDVVAGLEGATVGVVFGGQALALRAVGGDRMDLPGLAVIGERRAAGDHDEARGEILCRLRGLGRRRRRRFGSRLGDDFGCGCGLGFGRRLRGDGDGLGECVLQRGGVGRLQVLAAGVLGEAGDLPALLRRQAKAEDMGGEIDAGLLELLAERTGVGLAGLDAVSDENDG